MITRGCGIADSKVVWTAGEVDQLVADALTAPGPVFRVARVRVEKLTHSFPPQDGAWLKERFRRALLGTDG